MRRALRDSAPTFLTVLISLTLAACGQPLPSGTVVIAVERDVGALLPVIEQGSFDSEVNNLLYLGLNSQLWEDGVLEYVVDELSLAESWEFAPDSLSLTYRIWASAVWSDGQPITSADVVFTYELIRRPEIRVLDGDAAFARGEVERALAHRRETGDVVGEAQDERILGMALAASGELLKAEELLRSVITKAEELGRPHLAATASRELAGVLKRAGRTVEARVVVRETQRRFESLGAFTDAEKLEGFIEN